MSQWAGWTELAGTLLELLILIRSIVVLCHVTARALSEIDCLRRKSDVYRLTPKHGQRCENIGKSTCRRGNISKESREAPTHHVKASNQRAQDSSVFSINSSPSKSLIPPMNTSENTPEKSSESPVSKSSHLPFGHHVELLSQPSVADISDQELSSQHDATMGSNTLSQAEIKNLMEALAYNLRQPIPSPDSVPTLRFNGYGITHFLLRWDSYA